MWGNMRPLYSLLSFKIKHLLNLQEVKKQKKNVLTSNFSYANSWASNKKGYLPVSLPGVLNQ